MLFLMILSFLIFEIYFGNWIVGAASVKAKVESFKHCVWFSNTVFRVFVRSSE